MTRHSSHPASCVPDLVAEQAVRSPGAVAVQFGEDFLSYADLNTRAGRLAQRLIDRGVGPDVLVGLCVERSPEMVIGFLAILKAGGAVVPLDPMFPQPRLAFMLEDSRAPVVVTQRRVAEALPPTTTQAVFVEDDDGAATRDEPVFRATQEDLAYVIYTSGSTGRPKGVMIEHRSFTNVLRAMLEVCDMTVRDVVLAVSTLSFDIGCMDLCFPLLVGGRVVIVGAEEALFGGAVARLLSSAGVTFLQGTPSMWRVLIESGWSGSSGLKMVSTGEPLPQSLAASLLAGGGRLWNAYSATEGGIYVTVHEVRSGESSIPVGRPIPNTSAHVLGDGGTTPVQVGETGELHLGGVGVARGYLNLPELTGERFIPDPFVENPGARLYRTGDLGRYRPDGALEYLGRADDQVKLRGFRIELGEIEAALAAHPSVGRAVVVVREDEPGDRRLIAYVVGAEGRSLGARELRRYLMDQLPLYMVPEAVVPLDAFPLTPTRKVNRRALPPP
jgi:amino acid adenylation domain-containing protein